MTQTDLPVLEDGDLRLRVATMDDVDSRLALGSQPEIAYMFGVHPDNCPPLTREGAESWAKSRMETPYCWLIEHQGRLIGDTFFHTINIHDGRASLAIGLLDPDMLGKGFGSKALHLLIGYGFGPMGLHRITLRVLDYNERAIAAYKKAGFVIEGRERQAARVGDTRHDDLIMGLLAPEYHAARVA